MISPHMIESNTAYVLGREWKTRTFESHRISLPWLWLKKEKHLPSTAVISPLYKRSGPVSGSEFYSAQGKQSVMTSVCKVGRGNDGRKQCSITHITKYISRGILTPRLCSKPTIFPLLEAQSAFSRNKGKEK